MTKKKKVETPDEVELQAVEPVQLVEVSGLLMTPEEQARMENVTYVMLMDMFWPPEDQSGLQR